jgi:hypothetical protein
MSNESKTFKLKSDSFNFLSISSFFKEKLAIVELITSKSVYNENITKLIKAYGDFLKDESERKLNNSLGQIKSFNSQKSFGHICRREHQS